MISDIQDKIANILCRLSNLESKILGSDPVERVKIDLQRKKAYSSRLVTVPTNYYDLSLSERANLLGVNTSQLCKSIVFENTACDHYNTSDASYSRYYCVIIQYEAKFDAELLRNLIHKLRDPGDRLPRKRFHFVLADEEISHLLTGFNHNAVSPFGLLSKIPIVICSQCCQVNPSYIYLGGGDVHVKLGISIEDFKRSTNAIVGRVSEPR